MSGYISEYFKEGRHYCVQSIFGSDHEQIHLIWFQLERTCVQETPTSSTIILLSGSYPSDLSNDFFWKFARMMWHF